MDLAPRAGLGLDRGSRASAAWPAAVVIVLAVAALVATTPFRFVIARGQPLWLDETWTAAIAAQPSWAGVVRQAALDVNAPLYYLFAHLWAGLFGLSDASLRVPSALFGAAAPLLIAVSGASGLSRASRLTWAALIALWTPGLYLSGEARGYTLLLFLACANAVLYLRLMRRPSTARALAWAAVSALAILAHYHALILAGLEGLAYLAYRRGDAVRTWPAALAFLPPFAWLALHAARIAAFMRPGIAWYPLVRASRVLPSLAYPVGAEDLMGAVAAILVVCAIVGFVAGRILPQRRAEPAPSAPLWILAALAVVGVVLIVELGMVRASFTTRYLVPFVPGVLLAPVLIAARLGRARALALALLIAAFAWRAASFVQYDLPWMDRVYNWEVASNDLVKAHARHVTFVWDHPASPILTQDQLAGVGGFFFRRAHAPVEVEPVVLDAARDPNPRLLAAMKAPDSGLIWAYDIGVQGTAARRFRPRLTALDPALHCRQYGRGSIGVLACNRPGP